MTFVTGVRDGSLRRMAWREGGGAKHTAITINTGNPGDPVRVHLRAGDVDSIQQVPLPEVPIWSSWPSSSRIPSSRSSRSWFAERSLLVCTALARYRALESAMSRICPLRTATRSEIRWSRSCRSCRECVVSICHLSFAGAVLLATGTRLDGMVPMVSGSAR